MVWCRAGLRGDSLSVYIDFYLRATNLRKPPKPACTIPFISKSYFSSFNSYSAIVNELSELIEDIIISVILLESLI